MAIPSQFYPRKGKKGITSAEEELTQSLEPRASLNPYVRPEYTPAAKPKEQFIDEIRNIIKPDE